MNVLKFAEKIIYFIPGIFYGMHFMVTVFPEFIYRGGISINTQFKYADKNQIFRTTIQLDADIIQFIPDPGLFKEEDGGRELYKQQYQTHCSKVKQILEKADAMESLAWIPGIFVIITGIFIKDTYFHSSIILIIILNYVFRKLIYKWTFRACLKLAYTLF